MSKHLKRLASPRTWSIERKTSVWTVKPNAGKHKIEESLPLLVIIRDMLNYCDTLKEGKGILAKGEILIDGKKANDYKTAIGLMDVISVPKVEEYYRVLLDRRGILQVVKIKREDSRWKLVRIENKTTVKKGAVQLNLHDGRNILVEEDKYKTGDVLKIDLPSQKIMEHYELQKGNLALIIGGTHTGEISKISDYKIVRNPLPNIVKFENFETIKNYVFVVGREIPQITLPEVSIL